MNTISHEFTDRCGLNESVMFVITAGQTGLNIFRQQRLQPENRKMTLDS